MNVKILGISVIILSIGMMANAYAHTLEVVGDYKIEVGWENEPPVKGLDNAITFEVGIASDYDKAQAEAEDAAMEGMDMEGTDHHHEESDMNMTGMESGTAEQEHQMALDLEKQGKFAEAAEHHHMAATDLEKAGNYVDAAEHHHMAATDLEKAGDYAGAAEHHNMAADDLEKAGNYVDAAEHHHMAATDLEKAGNYVDAAEHHNMAADDLDKAGKHTEAVEHQHMATKDLAMVESSMDHGSEMGSMTHEDHGEEEHDMTTARGLLDNFKATVTFGGKDTPLKLVEDSQFPGVYHADFTPSVAGFPMVHIVGTLAGEDVDITFHPEEVEGLNTLRPLLQVKEGISPKNVECKSEYVLLLKTATGSPACVSTNSSAKLVELGWGTKA